MTEPKLLSVVDYNYDLDDARIAKYPLEERNASKLLIYKQRSISEDIYRNVANYLDLGSLIIFNDTKVIPARILFQKLSGGIIEIFCLEPSEENISIHAAMQTRGKTTWNCLVGGASKWKPGQLLEKQLGAIKLKARYVRKQGAGFLIEFNWTPADRDFASVIALAGTTPLPPYIKRKAEPLDALRYQTIYANNDGSVAAPTAGLHFTESIFLELKSKNISRENITLHVSAGTFKPVKTKTIGEHDMHAEYLEVSKTTIENLLKHSGKVVCVGTTSLRTIESLYWLGVKAVLSRQSTVNSRQSTVNSQQPTVDSRQAIQSTNQLPNQSTTLGQWEAYELEKLNIPKPVALNALLEFLNENKLEKLVAKTQLLIAPGYNFKMTDLLVTNFHQPNSTLLLLVAAFIGDDWKKVYDYALANDFRFLSYGDGCLLEKNN